MVTVTLELIERGVTSDGAWTRAQLAILGEEWPPKRGWKERAVGKQITDAQLERFLNAKKAKQGELFGGTNAYGEPL